MKKGRFKIQDKFTNMKKADGTPMSRQHIHMLRKHARGLCWICKEPTLKDRYFCAEHQISARERMRKKLGCKRRNKASASYVLEEKIAAAKTKSAKLAKSSKSVPSAKSVTRRGKK